MTQAVEIIYSRCTSHMLNDKTQMTVDARTQLERTTILEICCTLWQTF